MRIRYLRVKDFKGIREMSIDFPESGVTVLEGQNESGKSSLIEAFNQVLEQKHTTNAQRTVAARPVGRDVYSEIEAALAVGPYQLTIARRFHSGAGGRTTLHITGPRPETLTSDEAHNRLQEILNSHRDQTLWDALQVTQSGTLSQAALKTSTALRSALDAASGSEAADEEANAALFRRVFAERARYYTPTGLETGELARARQAERDASARAADLKRRVDTLDAVAGQIERLEGELTRLQDAIEPARQEATDRAQQVDELEQLETSVRQRDAAVEAIAVTIEKVELEQRQREELQSRHDALQQDVNRLKAELESLAPRVDATTSALDKASAARRDAEIAVDQAAQVRSRAKDDELLLRTEFELGQEESRLAQALKIQEQLAANRARLDTIGVDAGVLNALRRLTIAADAARLQSREGAPIVAIKPLRPLTGSANGDGLPLIPGESHELYATHQLHIHLDGIADITVTPPPAAAELADHLREATAALNAALREAGVANLEEAEARMTERADIERAIAEAPTRLKTLLQDLRNITELREKRDREARRAQELRARLPDGYQLPSTISEAEERLVIAERQESEGRDQLARLRSEEEAARQALDRARSSHKSIVTQLTVYRPQLAETGRQLTEARSADSGAAFVERIATARSKLESAIAHRDSERQRLEQAQPGVVRTRAENAARVAADLDKKLHQTREELAGERRLLDEHASEGLFEQAGEATSQAEHATRELASVTRRAAAAQLLYKTLNGARTSAQRRYAGPLSEHIERLGRVLYGPTFHIELSDDLTIKRRILDGTPIDFDHLSGGAKEQLAILARVATAMLVDPGHGVPLIIDDALGYTDPERLRAMGAVLSLAGNHCQVIVLTCYPGRYEHVGGATVIRMSDTALQVPAG